jgi:hypothetical protein
MNVSNPEDSHSAMSAQPNAVPQSAGFPRDPAAMEAVIPTQPAPGVPPASGLGAQPAAIGTSQWISAAKSIIDSTADDPYAQTELLYELRTQFMEQVHNRTLKQKDSSTK